MRQKTGFAAILAIIAALASFYATFTGSPIVGLLAAILSIPFGVIGLIMAASPRVSGGIISIVSIMLGVLGLIAAVLAIAGLILF